MPLPASVVAGRCLTSQAASDGVSVTASTSEVSSETTIVSASARKKTPVIAVEKRQRDEHHHRRERGADQRAEDLADAGFDGVDAARRRSLSRVWIASTTTMASSMTSPMAAAMPPSVIRLKVRPVSFIDTSVISTVTGMTVVATSVVLQLLRNA